MGTARKTMFLVVVCLVVLLIATGAAFGKTPKRVMIVVMDQMRPEYVQQYGMEHVKWLQDNGINYNKAYVGDMASETVVSHNVMVSGLFPKHMGWSDEGFRDVDNLLKYGAGTVITPGDFSYSQFLTLIDDANYPKLGDYLHAQFPDSVVANVGEKSYQVNSMAASSSDWWVYMGGKLTNNDPTFLPWLGKYRYPDGHVPPYIASEKRFLISSSNVGAGNGGVDAATAPDAYGTTLSQSKPAWIYPEDGRYVKGPATYAPHESGDTWVADAAIAIMQHEKNWSGLWVTFSAIDKIGHMWGGGLVDDLSNYTWTPGSITEQVHMPWAAKTADDQLGRLIDELKAEEKFKDTLIVVTADHGQTYGKDFYGVNELNAGNNKNWYLGFSPTGPESGKGNPNLAPLEALLNNGTISFSYQSTSIDTWVKDPTSWSQKVTTAAVVKDLPGVIATYAKDGDHYVLMSSSDSMTDAEYDWWSERGQELVDTMAFSGSADVVGLLADYTSYGAFGDHGGAQMDVQRIPMAFYAEGMQHLVRGTKFRLVDIMPTILRTMNIKPTAPMDGTAYNLPIK